MTRAVQELSPTGDPLVSGGVDALIGVVVVLVVAVLALLLWLLVRSRGLRRVGTPRRGAPLAGRLQELDDLHRRGLITDAEHAAARQRTLTSP